MTQNFLELAKKGDPRVLAGLINRALQSKGIAVKATQQGDITHFLFECSQDIPEPNALTDYLIQALTRLKAPPLSLLLSVRKTGQREVAWQRRLNFDPDATEALPTASPPPGLGVGTAAPIGHSNPQASNPQESTEDTTQLWDDCVSSPPTADLSMAAAAGVAGAILGTASSSLLGDSAEGEAEAGDDGTHLDEADNSWDQEDGLAGSEPAIDPVSVTLDPEAPDPYDSNTEDPEARSLSFFPFVTSAIVALLFALAGLGYRFFYYPSQQNPSSANPDVVVTTQPEIPADGGVTPDGGVMPDVSPDPVVPDPTETPSASDLGSRLETLGQNPWYEGVTVAMEAAILTQNATTYEEWDEIATYWEKAIELMAAVPPTDPNYVQAQERVTTYGKNLDYALQNAGF